MTIAVNQAVSNSSAGSVSSLAVNISNTEAGAAFLVTIGEIGNSVVDSITDTQGNSYTRVTGAPYTDATANYRLDQWYAQNVVGGASANTVTVNFSFAQGNRSVHVREIRGGKTSGIVDVAAGQNQATPTTSTDALTSGTASVTAQPALVLGFTAELTNSANVPAIGTGFTSDATAATFAGVLAWRAESKRITATGSNAATFTAAANTRHLTSMVVFLEATSNTVFPKRSSKPLFRA